ncbi:glycerol-3-phosphate 1-O-acyltransferase [Patulibacter sp. NPDC049589]|uniref:glycerol-3-phosphate 1-O-acyltransferase n=1 Tax=Patulibacter sp. NPDC049589 TaxID=3154731 RepID=UPI0034411CDA
MSPTANASRVEVVRPDGWSPDAPLVLLARAETAVERDLLRAAARELGATVAGDVPVVTTGDAAIAASRDGDRRIAPVRVVWTDGDADAGRPLGLLRDLVSAGEPSALRNRRQGRRVRRDPGRCLVVVGAPATIGELEDRWNERLGPSTSDDLPRFVERQADIALERAQRRFVGERYRAPLAVVDELTSQPAFVQDAARLAGDLGRDPAGVLADARAYLEEMATQQQKVARDVWVRWARFLYSRAYELQVDPQAMERLRELSTKHPIVFLPSHRSNLDGYVMAALLHDHGLPPNHTLGGINMAFWPIGALGRRVGVIWIRRTFKSNEIYKFTLRRYLGFLVSKRFNLEWYIEGGRSRTGKLLPPRLGLFNYLADAVEELDIEDVHVVPVSITYDELQEVAEMTTESRGHKKPAEGLRWMMDFARSQRGTFGGVQVTFGEPLALSPALRERVHDGPDLDEKAARRLARSKVAFEICTRINRATPVTPTSLVTLALLGGEDRALTLEELRTALEPLLTHVRARDIPGRERAEALTTAEGVERAVATLRGNGVVETFTDGPEPVVRIGPAQELVAAFYRNTAIHWFLTRAIVELALLGAATREPDAGEDPAAAALEDAFRIRDLLKFEFFFPEKDAYKAELQAELALIDPDWRDHGPDRITELGEAAARSGALMAHRVLRSFVEAYLIVADHLARQGDAPVDADEVVRRSLDLGRQYRLQRIVTSEEAVSSHLFQSALKLAANRGLVEHAPGLAERRAAFAAEVRDVQRRLRGIADFDRTRSRAAARVAG